MTADVAIKENFVKSFIVSYILVWKEVSVLQNRMKARMIPIVLLCMGCMGIVFLMLYIQGDVSMISYESLYRFQAHTISAPNLQIVQTSWNMNAKNTSFDNNSSTISTLLNQIAGECECPSCSKCGILNCWNLTTNQVSDPCEKLFEIFNTSAAIPIRRGQDLRSIMQAEDFDAILDFDCDHPLASAHFHVLMDCFNIQLSMVAMVLHHNQNTSLSDAVKKIEKVGIIYTPKLLRYMDLVCIVLETNGITPTFIGRSSFGSETTPATCLAQHISSKSIAFTARYSSWFVFRNGEKLKNSNSITAAKTGARLVSALVRHIYHNESQKCDKIVVLSRNNRGRTIMDEKDLLAALASNFGRANILVYNGSESFAETISRFRQACAVIGYHGAGSLNMLFTPRGTLCLEVVAFARTAGVTGSLSDWNAWRSNKGSIAEAAESKWQIKLIEPHHILPAKPWVENHVRDSEFKSGDIVLTREHISDILWRVESHLETFGHGLVLQKSKMEPVAVLFQIPAVRKFSNTGPP